MSERIPKTERGPVGPAHRRSPRRAPPTVAHALLDRLGNRGLAALRERTVQRKAENADLSVPTDPLEILAERVAEKVVGEPQAAVGPAPPPANEPAAGSDIQRDPVAGAPTPSGDSVPATPGPPAAARPPRPGGGPSPHGERARALLCGLDAGSPIPADARRFMEGRFERSFAEVRVHTGPRAAEAAASVAARAFTIGSEIVFGEGHWAPESPEGRRLLAHELAHVVQQGAGVGAPAAEAVTEADAERAARAVTNGHAADVQARTAPGAVQRDPENETRTVNAYARRRHEAEVADLLVEEPDGEWSFVGHLVGQTAIDVVSVTARATGNALRVKAFIAEPARIEEDNGSSYHPVDIQTVVLPKPQPIPEIQPTVPLPRKPPTKPTQKRPKPVPVEPVTATTEPPDVELPEHRIRARNPSEQVRDALKREPSTALAVAGAMSDAELAQLDTDTRVALLQAVATDATLVREHFDVVRRLLSTTPDLEAGIVEDRLNADNEKLRDQLADAAPPDGGWMALQSAVMNLSVRRTDKFTTLQLPPKLEIDFEAALKTGPLPRGFELPPPESEGASDLDQFKPVPMMFVGDSPSGLDHVRLERNGRGDTRYTYPDGTVATYDWQGRRRDPYVPGSAHIKHELGVMFELAQTGGMRFVPGKGWLDETGWAKHTQGLADTAETDAKRQVADFESYVQHWNEAQEGWSSVASAPSHLLAGRGFGEADDTARDTAQSVKHALQMMRKARTPGELERAQQSLDFAIGHGQRSFYQLREDVYGGAEDTIFVIKTGAVVATGAAGLAYAGGIAVTTIGGKMVVGLLTPLGTGALTANQAGMLEMADRGASWENYGKGAAWGGEVGFAMGSAWSAGKFIPLGGSGFGSQMLREGVGEGIGSGLSSAGSAWMHDADAEGIWKAGVQEGALGFVSGGIPSVATDVGLSWATSSSDEEFKRRLLSLSASRVGARMGLRPGRPTGTGFQPGRQRARQLLGEAMVGTSLALPVVGDGRGSSLLLPRAGLVVGPDGTFLLPPNVSGSNAVGITTGRRTTEPGNFRTYEPSWGLSSSTGPLVVQIAQAPTASTPVRRESAGARQTQGGIRTHQPAIAEQEAMGFLEPGSHGGAMASARTARSMATGIRADVGEAMSYNARLDRGEIGLLAPVGSNIPGPDSATAVRLPNGEFEIVVIDTKSRVSPTSQFGRVRSTLPQTWQSAVSNALAEGRFDLGEPALEAAIRDAWAQGRVRIARDTVDFSRSGQGEMRLDN